MVSREMPLPIFPAKTGRVAFAVGAGILIALAGACLDCAAEWPVIETSSEGTATYRMLAGCHHGAFSWGWEDSLDYSGMTAGWVVDWHRPVWRPAWGVAGFFDFGVVWVAPWVVSLAVPMVAAGWVGLGWLRSRRKNLPSAGPAAPECGDFDRRG